MTANTSTDWTRLGTRVAQASGMVSAQAECSPDDALLLMQARARADGHPLEELAIGVIERRIRFS